MSTTNDEFTLEWDRLSTAERLYYARDMKRRATKAEEELVQKTRFLEAIYFLIVRFLDESSVPDSRDLVILAALCEAAGVVLPEKGASDGS